MNESELVLFRGIPSDHVAWALERFRRVEVDYGMRLIEEGELDSTLIVVLDGELEVRTGDTLLDKAKAGAIVGEMALFGLGMRMASVETMTNATLLLLDKDGYEELRMANSPVALTLEAQVLEQLMNRLASVSDRISKLAEGTPVAAVTPSKGFFAAVRAMFGSGGQLRDPQLDVVAALAGSPLFEGLPAEGLAELAPRFSVAAYDPGAFLCTEGSLAHEMYLIASGLVDVIISTEGDRAEPLATLGHGDAFGMLALLDGRPRTASCVSKTAVELLVLDAGDWQDAVGSHSLGGSALRVAMIRCLSDQLSFANAQLNQLDIVKKVRQNELEPLLMASASMDSHGAYNTLSPEADEE